MPASQRQLSPRPYSGKFCASRGYCISRLAPISEARPAAEIPTVLVGHEQSQLAAGISALNFCLVRFIFAFDHGIHNAKSSTRITLWCLHLHEKNNFDKAKPFPKADTPARSPGLRGNKYKETCANHSPSRRIYAARPTLQLDVSCEASQSGVAPACPV